MFEMIKKILARGTAFFEGEIFLYVRHIFFSIVLGLAAGAGGILFHQLLEAMRHLFDPDNFSRVLRVNSAFVIIIPVIGAAVVASMTGFFPRQAAEKGVISVIKSIILNNGLIPLRNTIFHLFAPIISIGTGMPLGPEGPAAKIGSGMGSFMSQTFGLNRGEMMMYTAAGAGAAISAVFNAPIAGVFFGIEVVLLNDMKNRALSALIISSVVADVLSRGVMHGGSIFSIPAYNIGGVSSYPFYLGLGLVCGLLSVFYFMLKKTIGRILNDVLKIKNSYLKLMPVALLFGFVLLKYGQLFGIGYELTDSAVKGQIQFYDLGILLALKIIFLALFLTCGAYGGTFAPSLTIGALCGALFAEIVNSSTGMNLDPTAFALVGMGGALAGFNSIPLTSIMLVFEITADYKFILPLMFVSVIAYLVTVYYNKGSVYEAELLEEGIDVSRKGEADLLGRITCGRIMRPDFDYVGHRIPFRGVAKKILSSKYGELFVVNDSCELIGMISLSNVKQAISDNDLVDLLIAADISEPVDAVSENEPVSLALQKMERHDMDSIPVVESGNRLRITGILTQQDIIAAYNAAMKQVEAGYELINYSRR